MMMIATGEGEKKKGYKKEKDREKKEKKSLKGVRAETVQKIRFSKR